MGEFGGEEAVMLCSEKVPYASDTEAIRVVLHGLKRTNILRHYKCNICGKWHITHQKLKTSRKK